MADRPSSRLAVLQGHFAEVCNCAGVSSGPGGSNSSEKPALVILGGCVMDVQAAPGPSHSTQPGTSVPGTVRLSSGGVGRNIAEGAARILHGPGIAVAGKAFPKGRVLVEMVSAVGKDPAGDTLLESLRRVGVSTAHVQRSDTLRTAMVCAIFGSTGDIEGCVADVSILESALSEAALESPQIQGLLKSGAGTTVVLDANLGPGPLRKAAAMAKQSGCTVVVEPVSVAKSRRVTPEVLRHTDFITPNIAELHAIARPLRGSGKPGETSQSTPTPSPTNKEAFGAADAHFYLNSAVRDLAAVLRTGLGAVVLTMGARGAALCRLSPDGNRIRCVHVPAIQVPVVSLIGAGDCLTAGFASCLARGTDDETLALAVGVVAASRSVSSRDNVPENLGASGLVEESWRCLSSCRRLNFRIPNP